MVYGLEDASVAQEPCGPAALLRFSGKCSPAVIEWLRRGLREPRQSVVLDLRGLEGVDEAFAVYGVYDIVARVRAETMDKLKEIVTWRIRRLDKVRSTLTMI
ncbi:MAG: Lrp/AsnC ligand binding domain-containing protein, partial [Planctomycetota bacterium]